MSDFNITPYKPKGLEEAHVGTILATTERGFKTVHLYKVAKVNKMSVTTEHGTRFRIEDGLMIGGSSWNIFRARIATEEDIRQHQIQNLQIAISKFKVTPENMERVNALLQAEPKGE